MEKLAVFLIAIIFAIALVVSPIYPALANTSIPVEEITRVFRSLC